MKDYRVLASPFRRLLSFIIDMFILGIIGFLLSLVFKPIFINIGVFGKFIGFIITGIYFTVLESELQNGQSIGKKILKLKVIDNNGEALKVKDTIIRYSIWGICYFINGASFSQFKHEALLSTIGTIILFGIGFIIMFLFIFNRKTKQSLHDLIVKSYVIDTKKDFTIEDRKINKFLIPVSILLPILAFSSIYFINKDNNTIKAENLTSKVKILTEMSEVYDAGVTSGTTTFKSINGSKSSTEFLRIEVVLNEDYSNKNEIATNIVENIINFDNSVLEKDIIIVGLSYGYDIGIWSRSNSFSIKYPPMEWEKKIQEM